MKYNSIDVHTLNKWLNEGSAILIDVREPAEYRAEHISGAELMPLSIIKRERIPATDKKIVLHCKKGARAVAACEKLIKEDPQLEVYNLDGGIEMWSAKGFKTRKSGRFSLSLDRQVQLTIGSLIITASIAGYFTSIKWFIMTGVIGGGLFIAGITGFCGLAIIMAKMPWNK